MTQIEDICKKAREYFEAEKYLDAMRCYEQAILLSPHDPDLWNSKGLVLRAMGRYDEAVECFNKSLKIDPRDKFSS